MKKIVIFASGNGGNAEAIMKACKSGEINAQVIALICDKKDAYCIKRAENQNVKTIVVTPGIKDKKYDYEKEVISFLQQNNVDLICLAGYMRILSKQFCDAFPNKIINIHPSLLPSFKGMSGIMDAYQYGVKVFGVTVHYVDHLVDHGQIIDQDAFHISEVINKDNTEQSYSVLDIEEKIHQIEHRLYVKVVKKLTGGA